VVELTNLERAFGFRIASGAQLMKVGFALMIAFQNTSVAMTAEVSNILLQDFIPSRTA
jgi:hypothetical protein